MTKTTTITVAADPDQDDCLTAAAAEYVEEHPEAEGWDLSPRWADDSREMVALDVPVLSDHLPAHVATTDLAVVERMPEQHRDSHRAAGNWGTYPANGAERVLMSREDAESAVEGDEYDHIVRDATTGDAARYEIVSE